MINPLSRHLLQLYKVTNQRVKLPLHALDALFYLIGILGKPMMILSLEDPFDLLVNPVDLDPHTFLGYHSLCYFGDCFS